jgi:beta-lactamase class A
MTSPARQYAWVRVSRPLLLSLATLVIMGGVALIGLGLRSDGAAGDLAERGNATTRFAGAAAPRPAAPTGPDPAELARKERQRRVAALDAALKKYAATVPEFSVAVLDARTGQRYAYRGAERYESASVVKVQVLACLLLTAQDEGRRLTSTELSRAGLMIRISDNDATTALFRQLGRVPSLTACNKRLGLTSTAVRPSWGLTQTTVNDQVKLLSELVDEKGPLDSRSRKIVHDLMSTVQADQRWGVSAAATDGEDVTIKNGWLQRSTENGRWIINSVGRITGDDIEVSLAVLSHGHPTDRAGMDVVEKVAELTREHLRY